MAQSQYQLRGEDDDVDKISVHTTSLEAAKDIRRSSIPQLAYRNEFTGTHAISRHEGWMGETLEIEEPGNKARTRVYTDYPEGGFGWVIVFCKSIYLLSLL
ncbi:hypothetical protein QFC19_006711 [Naganishia cerealis]|uniref:Uncharacterized protein n=1 Tax=Naganishia cerealis TaxID=610337 RepID=A0ACC2VDY8_9TREE|nr:hypothetical protein QFC19_006711 [Naganishia cerealis]